MRRDSIIVLLTLSVCELLWFGPIIDKVGFYLDDWRMFSALYWSKPGFHSLLNTAFADDRVFTRPLEALFFPLTWLLCGHEPLQHHLLNCVLEVLSCWFLYLGLVRLLGQRYPAFLSALLFLLLPLHDVTHYWVVAMSLTFSMALYTFSLWQAVESVSSRRQLPYVLSVLAFLASMFNYESFAPLCLVTAASIFYLNAKSGNKLPKACKLTICLTLPYLLCVLAFLFYTKVVLHGAGFQHPIVFDFKHIVDVYINGWNSTMSPATFEFYYNRAREGFAGATDRWQRLDLLLINLIVFASALWLTWQDRATKRVWLLVVLGLIAVLGSYSIYAVAAEYTPDRHSIWNRLNYGASLGAALLIVGAVNGIIARLNLGKLLQSVILSILVLPIVNYLVMADWGMARPWVWSWQLQREIIALAESQSCKLHAGDAVILSNVPRYLFWAPVFDGIWDFQSMLRWKIRQRDIKANVISERLVVSPSCLTDKDAAHNFVIAAYPYKRLFVLTPVGKQLVPIGSAEEFIAFADNYRDSCGMSKEVIQRWQRQLSSDTANARNSYDGAKPQKSDGHQMN